MKVNHTESFRAVNFSLWTETWKRAMAWPCRKATLAILLWDSGPQWYSSQDERMLDQVNEINAEGASDKSSPHVQWVLSLSHPPILSCCNPLNSALPCVASHPPLPFKMEGVLFHALRLLLFWLAWKKGLNGTGTVHADWPCGGWRGGKGGPLDFAMGTWVLEGVPYNAVWWNFKTTASKRSVSPNIWETLSIWGSVTAQVDKVQAVPYLTP